MAKNLLKLSSSPSCNSGSILVAAIWILAFFIILTVGLYAMVSGQIRLAARAQQTFFGKYLAHSACVYAMAKRNESELPYDVYYELRKEQKVELANNELSYYLVDEESKVNINTVSSEVIKRLFAEAGGLSDGSAQQLADAILVQRGEREFSVKEELLNIDEVKPDLYQACKDFLTVYGKGEVNINTAPGEVLAALGLEEDLVLLIKDFRLGFDGKEGTEDDGYFENTGDIVTKLMSFRMLSEKQKSDLLSLITNGFFIVKSDNFTLKINTKVSGKSGMNYIIVVDSKNIIREWVEY